MVVDELRPGKYKGNSHPTVVSVFGTVVGMAKQRLETTRSHGVISLLGKRGAEKANLMI